MDLLTRSEELVMLAVWKLQERAYSVVIRERLMDVTGKFWSFGAVYMPLDRLAKKGLLESRLNEPTPERGGRSKRIYSLTDSGLQALVEIRKVQDEMWAGTPEIVIGKTK